MAIKKGRRKTVKKKNNNKLAPMEKEGLGIVLILLGIVFFICTFSNKMGMFGDFINRILSGLAGTGNFLLPLILIFFGIVMNTNLYKRKKIYYFFTILVGVCILIFLDGTKSTDLTLVERLRLAMEYGSVSTSGGLIGAMFGFFLYKLFGTLGTRILLSALIIFSLGYMFKINFSHIKGFVKDSTDKVKSIDLSASEDKPKFFDKIKEALPAKKAGNDENELDTFSSVDDYNNIKEVEFMDVKIPEDIEAPKAKEEQPKAVKKIKEDPHEREEETEKLDTEIKEASKNKPMVYKRPPVELLERSEIKGGNNNQEMAKSAQIIKDMLNNFGIECKIIAVNKGPSITCYEIQPAPGVKLSKIVSLSDNLSMALASPEIRIEAPIPGKAAVGIEVPNKEKESVGLRDLIDSREFKLSKTNLPLVLGKNVSGEIIVSSIDKMPHLLIAGATGSGKSVCINSIITSILYKSSPEDVKLMLIDPKVVELSVYNGIPHLLIPVVTDAKKASFALNWAVEEMEKRYKAFAKSGTRDLKSYNNKMIKQGQPEEKFPQIVIIVDELADLMMVAASEVEDYIARLAQMARAAGIYLIIATQRPSVDVITGTIKANIPSRIAFSVSSSVDSRTILDVGGAEKLLGKGDMLFAPSYLPKPLRIQGAFISDDEVERIVDFVTANNKVEVEGNEVMEKIELKNQESLIDRDPLFNDAVKFVVQDEQASISFLQRKLKVGYSRAARIVDQMEEAGIIGPHEGSKPRTIIMSPEEIEKYLGERNE